MARSTGPTDCGMVFNTRWNARTQLRACNEWKRTFLLQTQCLHVRAVSCDWREQPACSHASIFVAVTPHFFSFVPCWTRHYIEIIPLIVVVRAFIPIYVFLCGGVFATEWKLQIVFYSASSCIVQPFYHLHSTSRFQWNTIQNWRRKKNWL